jgi:hypothetical protein
MTGWTVADIENRLLEAAMVELSLPRQRLGPAGIKGSSINRRVLMNFSDLVSQAEGTPRKPSDQIKWSWGKARSSPPAGAIRRYEEMLFHVARILPFRQGKTQPEKMAACMWAWAFNVIGEGMSFSRWCKKNQIKRLTAYRYKDAAILYLLKHFQAERISVEKFLLPEVIQIGDKFRMKTVDLPLSPSPQSTILERPTKPDFNNPAYVEALSNHIEKSNERNRSARDRSTRRKQKASQCSPSSTSAATAAKT